MNYFKIGQKIRYHRKQRAMSQEQLAEMSGISVTHMSHIETGNTKLSLAVFVDIATALNVSANSLLFDNDNKLEEVAGELNRLLVGCTTEQAEFILTTATATKGALLKIFDCQNKG